MTYVEMAEWEKLSDSDLMWWWRNVMGLEEGTDIASEEQAKSLHW